MNLTEPYLRRIRLADDDVDAYTVDCELIAAAMKAHRWDCSPAMARELWERYSASMCAGWMRVPENTTEIVMCISPYFDEDEE